MTPQTFEEQSKTLTGPPGVGDLPVYSDGNQCISCWRPSWRERLSVLIFGRVWLQVHAGRTQPPVALSGSQTIFEKAAT